MFYNCRVSKYIISWWPAPLQMGSLISISAWIWIPFTFAQLFVYSVSLSSTFQRICHNFTEFYVTVPQITRPQIVFLPRHVTEHFAQSTACYGNNIIIRDENVIWNKFQNVSKEVYDVLPPPQRRLIEDVADGAMQVTVDWKSLRITNTIVSRCWFGAHNFCLSANFSRDHALWWIFGGAFHVFLCFFGAHVSE